MSGYMDFAGEPFLANKASPADAFSMGEYNAFAPGTGYDGMGALPATTKAIVRPRPGAVPGWPGFFGWLAATHPEMYDYARVSLPNAVEDRQGIVSAGSQLGDYRGTRSSETGRVLNGLGDYRGSRSSETGRVLNGLVDPSWDDPADPFLNGLAGGGQASSEGITDSTPMPTTTGSGGIADVLSKLAATFIPIYTQKKVFDLQLDRAQKGLPPVDMNNVMDNTGLNVGINKGTQNTLLMLGGLVLGGILLSKMLGKR